MHMGGGVAFTIITADKEPRNWWLKNIFMRQSDQNPEAVLVSSCEKSWPGWAQCNSNSADNNAAGLMLCDSLVQHSLCHKITSNFELSRFPAGALPTGSSAGQDVVTKQPSEWSRCCPGRVSGRTPGWEALKSLLSSQCSRLNQAV